MTDDLERRILGLRLTLAELEVEQLRGRIAALDVPASPPFVPLTGSPETQTLAAYMAAVKDVPPPAKAAPKSAAAQAKPKAQKGKGAVPKPSPKATPMFWDEWPADCADWTKAQDEHFTAWFLALPLDAEVVLTHPGAEKRFDELDAEHG